MNTVVRGALVSMACLLATGLGAARAADKGQGHGPGHRCCEQPGNPAGFGARLHAHLLEGHPEADTNNDGTLSGDEFHSLLGALDGPCGCAEERACGCGGPKDRACSDRAKRGKPCDCGAGPGKRACGAPKAHACSECGMHAPPCGCGAGPGACGPAHNGPCPCDKRAMRHEHGEFRCHRAHKGHAPCEGCGKGDGPYGCGKHTKPCSRAAGPRACGCGVQNTHACSECGMHAPPRDCGARPGTCDCAPHRGRSGCGDACDSPCPCGKPGPRGAERVPPHSKRCGHKHGHGGWM
jgi:hypothetical protein